MKGFSCHFIFAFQVAHDPFIVVILAHNNSQSVDSIWIFSLLLEVLLFICSCDHSDANRVNGWVNSWFNTQLFYLSAFFWQDNYKCIYFNCTGTLNMSVSIPLNQQSTFLANECLVIMSWCSFGTQLHRRVFCFPFFSLSSGRSTGDWSLMSCQSLFLKINL